MKTLLLTLAIATFMFMSCEPLPDPIPEPEPFNYQLYLTGDWRYDPIEGSPVFYIYSFTSSRYSVTYFTQMLVHETNEPTYYVDPLYAEITFQMATYYEETKVYPNPTEPDFVIVIVRHDIQLPPCTIDVIDDKQMVLTDDEGREYLFNKL